MTKVAVVFHSGYGHTQRMAQAVAQGADAELITIDADGNLSEGAWETLAAADAIVFGSHQQRQREWRQALHPALFHDAGHATRWRMGRYGPELQQHQGFTAQ